MRMHSESRKPYRLGELFCGAGGMALGASQALPAEFEHVWAFDKDKDACETLRSGGLMDPDTVREDDVRDIDFSKLPPIDGLVFGFPCNDFSVAGQRKGLQGRYGPLYTYGVAALKALRPAFFVAENVPGLSSANYRSDFKRILHDLMLAGPGYQVTAHMYKMEEYGVPQKRHRYIIVGFRDDLHVWYQPPMPNYRVRTAGEALADIPPDAPNHEIPRTSEVVAERLRHIKPGENYHVSDMPERLKIQFKSDFRYSATYRRLHPDEPAYTVIANGGGGVMMYHYSENRAVTNRERARLQTFPDWYHFKGGASSVRRQIGMAVPPLAAQIVFESVGEHLHDIDIR